MTPTLNPHSLLDRQPLSAQAAGALLAQARRLREAAQAGTMQALLKGKKLGLLCESVNDADADLFRQAAGELGAQVSHIGPRLSELGTPEDVAHAARLLGRLYDAVECQGMASALVRQVGDAAGVPVYDGSATQGHPTARLAEQLDGGSTPGNRRFVLQALLLCTID